MELTDAIKIKVGAPAVPPQGDQEGRDATATTIEVRCELSAGTTHIIEPEAASLLLDAADIAGNCLGPFHRALVSCGHAPDEATVIVERRRFVRHSCYIHTQYLIDFETLTRPGDFLAMLKAQLETGNAGYIHSLAAVLDGLIHMSQHLKCGAPQELSLSVCREFQQAIRPPTMSEVGIRATSVSPTAAPSKADVLPATTSARVSVDTPQQKVQDDQQELQQEVSPQPPITAPLPDMRPSVTTSNVTDGIVEVAKRPIDFSAASHRNRAYSSDKGLTKHVHVAMYNQPLIQRLARLAEDRKVFGNKEILSFRTTLKDYEIILTIDCGDDKCLNVRAWLEGMCALRDMVNQCGEGSFFTSDAHLWLLHELCEEAAANTIRRHELLPQIAGIIGLELLHRRHVETSAIVSDFEYVNNVLLTLLCPKSKRDKPSSAPAPRKKVVTHARGKKLPKRRGAKTPVAPRYVDQDSSSESH